MTEPKPLAYRIPEAAAQLGISRATLYRQVAAGAIRTVKIGGCTLVERAELTRYLQALRVPPKAA